MNASAPNLKEGKFVSYNKEKGISFYQRYVVGGYFNTVVFAAAVNAQGGNKLGMIIITDNSLYTMIRARLGIPKKGKHEETMKLFNEMNEKYPMFKFYIGTDKTAYMESAYLSEDKAFDPALVHSMAEVAIVFLQKQYEKFSDCLDPDIAGSLQL
jgi:hypothetical protein